MEKEKDTELLLGIMVKNLKETGDKGLNQGLEFGSHLREIIMRDSGKIIDKKEKECFDIKSVHIKDNS